MSRAKTHWLALARDLGLDRKVSAHWWRRIEAAYREPQRRYHVLRHLGQFFQHLERFCFQGQSGKLSLEGQALKIAVFFHDIVYDPTARDNEERSAILAESFLRENGLTELIPPVCTLIRATASHMAGANLPLSGTGLSSEALHLFLDCDLLILAAKPRAYRTYVEAVEYEYSHLPRATFNQGRAAFLAAFLKHPKLFHTEAVAAAHEAQARSNLSRELKAREFQNSATQ